MKVDRIHKSVILNEYDLENGFPCPECGRSFRPNGTGPSSCGFFAKLLKGVPSELVVGGIPPRFHDVCYLLCPNGWTVMFKPSEVTYEAKNKPTADKEYYSLMIDQHKDARGLAAVMLKIIAKRNYLAVKVGGQSSYCHKH